MENNYYSNDNNAESDMIITSQARAFLRETAKWAKFLAILGFIGIAFLIIAAFFIGGLMSALPGAGTQGVPSGVFTIVYLAFAALYTIPVYYLYQFSGKTRDALEANDNSLLTEAFGFLKSHYKFIGILTIVIISIYVLVFLIAIIGVAARGTSML